MKAIMYGAGNIGRGFIGQLLSMSGYEVVFIDVDDNLVAEINLKKRYPVKTVSNDDSFEEWVENVRAVNGKDKAVAAREIASADIMATAVGANILPKIAPVIAQGLALRFENNTEPFNIIICENLLGAGAIFKGLIQKELPKRLHSTLAERVGFVEASIGRMVPVMTKEMSGDNILRICVEPYNKLPVDKDAFVGSIPEIVNLQLYSPFDFYVKRKLFIHNLGHAACAYLGQVKGYEFIWQAIADTQIRDSAKQAMMESAAALSKHYGLKLQEMEVHIEDLLDRFSNKALSDSVARVGRDTLRKLSPNDRLAGSVHFCKGEKFPYSAILKIISAALLFSYTSDESTVKMHEMINENGESDFLKSWCKLSADDARKVMDIKRNTVR